MSDFSVTDMSKREANKSMYLAEWFKSENKICVFDNIIRIYNPKLGYFEAIDKNRCVQLLYSFVNKNAKYKFTLSNLKKCYDLILADASLYKKLEPSPPALLNCKNCVWDVLENKFYKHSPHYNFTYCIQAKCNSNKGTKDKYFKRFISDFTSGVKDREKLLQEWCGYLLSGSTSEKKFALLYGPSNTGKSVFLRLLTELFGQNDVSAVTINKLNSEFYLEEMCRHRVNICAESENSVIKNLSNIKQLVGDNDAIMIRKPHCSPVRITEKPKLMFSTNSLPEIVGSTSDLTAFFNRVIVIPCTHIVKHPDKQLSQKLLENKNAILLWAATGLRRYLKNGEFSNCKSSKQENKHYRLLYNAAAVFFDKKIQLKADKRIYTNDLEKALKKFIKANGIEYKSEYMAQLRIILKEQGVINKKIRIDGQAPKQGFIGIKIKK